MEPMLLALDTTLPLWVLSTKSPGKKEASITKEWGTLPGPQSPTGTVASNADLCPSTAKPARSVIHFMLQCSCPCVYTAHRPVISGSQRGIWMQRAWPAVAVSISSRSSAEEPGVLHGCFLPSLQLLLPHFSTQDLGAVTVDCAQVWLARP